MKFFSEKKFVFWDGIFKFYFWSRTKSKWLLTLTTTFFRIHKTHHHYVLAEKHNSRYVLIILYISIIFVLFSGVVDHTYERNPPGSDDGNSIGNRKVLIKYLSEITDLLERVPVVVEDFGN